MSKKNNNSEKSDSAPAPTLFEWAVRIISIVTVVGLIGYFLYQTALPVQETSFAFVVDQENISQRGREWAVPVTITNQGSKSIQTLVFVAEHRGGESAEVTVGLLGVEESTSVEIMFTNQPLPGDLSFNVDSYSLP